LYAGLEDRIFAAPGSWNMKQCEKCGVQWLDPMPLPQDLELAYADYYTHEPGTEMQTRSSSRRLYDFGLGAVAWLSGLRSVQRRAEFMFLDPRRPGRLLDVGCGQGIFLHRMQKSGWQVEGTDFDPGAADAARRRFGVEVRVGDLRSLRYPAASFDAVTLNHVLEHLLDPLETLQECRRILKSSGILSVRTPNISSFGHRRFKHAWRGLEPPRHVYLFSPTSLAAVARKAGFDRIKTWSGTNRYIYVASIDLRDRGAHRMNGSRASLADALKGILTEHWEHLAIRLGKQIGEEAWMLAE
jgi:2-polyprenyl-3-methyl-5-hydroxy-6-metoxy-1,4-benzoquinol methylase